MLLHDLGVHRTNKAAIYPEQLIDAVSTGVNDQIRADQFDLNLVASIDIAKGMTVSDELKKIQLSAAQWEQPVP